MLEAVSSEALQQCLGTAERRGNRRRFRLRTESRDGETHDRLLEIVQRTLLETRWRWGHDTRDRIRPARWAPRLVESNRVGQVGRVTVALGQRLEVVLRTQRAHDRAMMKLSVDDRPRFRVRRNRDRRYANAEAVEEKTELACGLRILR